MTTAPGAGIPFSSYADYVDHALPHFVDRNTYATAMTYYDYPMLRLFFNTQVMQMVGHGNSLEWRAIYKRSGAAKYIRPFEVTPDNYVNVFTKGQVSWRHIETKAVMNLLAEGDMSGPDSIVNYTNGKMYVAVQEALDLLERAPWEVPFNANDDKKMLGIPYWLPPLGVGVTDATGGFNGQTTVYGNGDTSSEIGGIDRARETYARSWAATHPGEVNQAYLRTLRRAMVKTGFREPDGLREFIARQNRPDEVLYFTGTESRLQYEDLVNSGPDDRNGDLNPFKDEGLTYRGMRWIIVPALDDASLMDGYGVRRQWMYPVANSMFWGRRDKAERLADRFTTRTAWDWRAQILNKNPRQSGWRLHTVRAA